LNGQKI